MPNTFGKIFKLTTFGESHGAAVGGVVDGCPSNFKLDFNLIQKELDRRKPGQSSITTQRKETDKVEFLSGIFEGKTTGAPIGFIIKNENQNPKDYENLKNLFRPSHADYTYQKKFGIRDYRGGGRSSARETVARVVGGAIAKQILSKQNISITAFVSQVGEIKLNKCYKELDFSKIEKNAIRCPDEATAKKMLEKIDKIKNAGDSIGGIIKCVIKNVPAGIGEPVFYKLQAQLANAMLGINAVKGFDYGSGFENVEKKGSEINDLFVFKNNKVTTLTNYSGGIQGGISNGEDIYFRIAFKPTATILKPQKTLSTNEKAVGFTAQGKHDPCVLPRAVPIVEAMSAMVLLDNLLINNAYSK
ncbi:MAG: chorismate synthase [Bacteroidales bacterium]|nr:chorismate synthase [Bacteroidales bacterium]